MSDQNDTLPLGKLLQNAGLISSEQLAKALELQSQYNKLKLGEILVLQEDIQAKTVDFFLDNWQEVKQNGKQFPLGYYLKQASLLNDLQIKAILSEQKESKLKFGDIAIQKGWLDRSTINFFVSNIALKPPKLMSLIALEEYNQKSLHLERKYTDASLILSRILAWTGGHPTLTKSICNVFVNSDLNIPDRMEVKAVDKLIERSLIRNWQTTKLGGQIRAISEKLLNNSTCEPILLLAEYEKILLSENREYLQTKEQEELLILGIVVKERNRLRITNLIFQQVFDRDWILGSKKLVESKIERENLEIIQVEKTDNSLDKDDNNSLVRDSLVREDIVNRQDKTTNIKETEPLTKFSSLLTLVGVILFIPLVLAINNYYSSLKQGQQLTSNSTLDNDEMEEFCSQINTIDPSSSLNLIYQLEKNKQARLDSPENQSKTFPAICETALNTLRVLAAPQLGKEDRTIEAIKHLCKIPADAENINEAKVWLEHWYTSPSWGKETKSYLNLVDSCPAGDR